jgi:hypothetical protein
MSDKIETVFPRMSSFSQERPVRVERAVPRTITEHTKPGPPETRIAASIDAGPSKRELEEWYHVLNDLVHQGNEDEEVADLRDSIYRYLR